MKCHHLFVTMKLAAASYKIYLPLAVDHKSSISNCDKVTFDKDTIRHKLVGERDIKASPDLFPSALPHTYLTYKCIIYPNCQCF